MKLFQRLTQRWHSLVHESAVRAAYDEGRFEDGVAHARVLYDFDLDNPWANFFLACHHLESERYGEALGHLERVRQDWPEDAYTHFALGPVSRLSGRPPRRPSATIARCCPCPRSGARPARTWAATSTCSATIPRPRPPCATTARPPPTTARPTTCSATSATARARCAIRSATTRAPGVWTRSTRKMERNARLLYMKSARS